MSNFRMLLGVRQGGDEEGPGRAPPPQGPQHPAPRDARERNQVPQDNGIDKNVTRLVRHVELYTHTLLNILFNKCKCNDKLDLAFDNTFLAPKGA